MIVHLKDDFWIKVKTYIIGSNNTLRNSETAYKKDNSDFYNKYENKFTTIWDSKNTISCKLEI